LPESLKKSQTKNYPQKSKIKTPA